MSKTIEEYQAEYEKLHIQHEKLNKKMVSIRKKMVSLKTSEEKEYVKNIPFDDVTKITEDQWKWILYHWHGETEFGYKTRTNFLRKIGLNTNGIAGNNHSEDVKQFNMGLHHGADIKPYIDFLNLTKNVLVKYPSPIDKQMIISFDLYVSLFGWSEDDGVRIEFDLDNNKARFIRAYRSYNNSQMWMPIKDAVNLLELELKKKQSDVEDDDMY